MKIGIIILGVFSCLASDSIYAQGAVEKEQWTLGRCIEYAIGNNIAIQQNKLIIEDSDIQLNTAKNSRLPSLNANAGGNMFFGRGPSRDGTYIDNNQASSSFGVNMSVPVYEGSRINNTIKVSELNLKAVMHGYEKAKEDLSLNIVAFYMQILFSKELLKVGQTQLELSEDFVNKTDILYKNGKVAESEYYESLSLLARDKVSVIESENRLKLTLLDLAHALNLPNSHDFDVVTPVVDSLDVRELVSLTPADLVYNTAVNIRPEIKSEEYKLSSYLYNLKIVKSAYIPSVNVSLGYNNSYYHSFMTGANNANFIEQMKVNGSETIGLSISVPIFNKFATRNRIRSANVSIRNQELVLKGAKQMLQKEIELSYQNADASGHKYFASMQALVAAQMAFKFEKEKVAAGRSTIFDFNDSKTMLFRAESEVVTAKYEFLFNKKILDFYYGVPL